MGPDAGEMASVVRYLECLYRNEDPHDVQSSVHDAWFKLRAAGRPVTGGWLFSEAKGLLRTRSRQRVRRQMVNGELADGMAVAKAGVARPEFPAVAAAVDGLTEAQRFVARGLICGETVREQAAAGGVSPNAIKIRVAAVRERLRRLLNPDGTATGRKAKGGPGRTDRSVFFRGRTMTLKAVAAEVGMTYPTLHRRVASGMSVEDAVARPVASRGTQ